MSDPSCVTITNGFAALIKPVVSQTQFHILRISSRGESCGQMDPVVIFPCGLHWVKELFFTPSWYPLFEKSLVTTLKLLYLPSPCLLLTSDPLWAPYDAELRADSGNISQPEEKVALPVAPSLPGRRVPSLITLFISLHWKFVSQGRCHKLWGFLRFLPASAALPNFAHWGGWWRWGSGGAERVREGHHSLGMCSGGEQHWGCAFVERNDLWNSVL